jgi:hypothetical protein
MQTNCNYNIVAKTCQKPYAKTPQKTHKNSTQKSGLKIPQKTFHKILTQKLQNIPKTF